MSHEPNAEQAKANPSKQYAHPMDVVRDESIEPPARLIILKRWEQEARDLQRAADENMTGGEPSLLPDVRKAIDTLCQRYGIDEKKDGQE
jgi:hypothetical protein